MRRNAHLWITQWFSISYWEPLLCMEQLLTWMGAPHAEQIDNSFILGREFHPHCTYLSHRPVKYNLHWGRGTQPVWVCPSLPSHPILCAPLHLPPLEPNRQSDIFNSFYRFITLTPSGCRFHGIFLWCLHSKDASGFYEVPKEISSIVVFWPARDPIPQRCSILVKMPQGLDKQRCNPWEITSLGFF